MIEKPELKGYEIALKTGGTALEVVIDPTGKILENNAVAKNPENNKENRK